MLTSYNTQIGFIPWYLEPVMVFHLSYCLQLQVAMTSADILNLWYMGTIMLVTWHDFVLKQNS